MSSSALQILPPCRFTEASSIQMEVAVAAILHERLCSYPNEWSAFAAYDASLPASWVGEYADVIAQCRRVCSAGVLRSRLKHLSLMYKLLSRQLMQLIRSVKSWVRQLVDPVTTAHLITPMLDAELAIKTGNLIGACRLVVSSRERVGRVLEETYRNTSTLEQTSRHALWRFEEIELNLRQMEAERKETELWVSERSPEGEMRRWEMNRRVDKLLTLAEQVPNLPANIRQAYTRPAAINHLKLQGPRTD